LLERSPARRRVLRPGQVRDANAALVLALLRRHQRLSRAELARRTGLSEGAVSRITAGLLGRGLITEEGAENSTGGRPAIRLRLDQSRFFSLGAVIGNWETRLAVGTLAGTIIESWSVRTPPGPDRTLKLIADEFNRRRRRLRSRRLWGLGVAVRGLVNSETGVVEMGNDPRWVQVPVKQELEQATGAAVFVENDVRAAALAEYHATADLQASHCLLFVKVDEGLGMAVVLDGRLYRGSHLCSGEVGQMVIAYQPGPERHDRPGCLERLAANAAACERYSRLCPGRRPRGSGDAGAQLRRICHQAVDGDTTALQAIQETCRYLGLGIANLIWLFDPDVIVIDGAVTDAWPLVVSAVREQFPDSGKFRGFQEVVLRPSSLAGEATIVGAASLPFAGLFSIGAPC